MVPGLAASRSGTWTCSARTSLARLRTAGQSSPPRFMDQTTGRRLDGPRALRNAEPAQDDERRPDCPLVEPAQPGQVRLSGTFGGLPVSVVAVDAGFLTSQVKAQTARRRWWVPVVGRSGEGLPIARGISKASGVAPVGKYNTMSFWAGRVAAGKVHFGMDLDRRALTELAAAEALTAGKSGGLTWQPIPGRQNHRSDCANYAIFARNFRRLTRTPQAFPRLRAV